VAIELSETLISWGVKLDPSLLRSFLAVARAGSVSAAATTLHRSQPAVSAQVRALEAALGERLFVRGARGVRLTDLGERLRPHAEALERVMAGVAELAHEARELGTGRLAIAASTTIALYWLPRHLVAFGRAYPSVRVRVMTRNSREAVAALAAGEVDVAFVEGRRQAWQALPSGLYDARAVHHDEIVVVVPPGHPLAGRERLHVADLDGLAVVGREVGSGTRDVVQGVLDAAGVRVDVRLELTEPEAMKRAVRAGVGAAFLSRIAVHDEVAAGHLVAVPCSHTGLRRDFTLLAPGHDLASRATRAFVALAGGDAVAWAP
jgi:DNA-binding transcriptional LysR family regulator